MQSSFSHAAAVRPATKPGYRQQRAALFDQQRQERNGLWERQQAERVALQDKWVEINGDRAKAWAAYGARSRKREKLTPHAWRIKDRRSRTR